ncbi:hypothetical protein HWV62_34231 [Athelia sp. TMB]|nr:hypothetical protein HWV62_34231 [Athelia sp. TMB]
MIIDQNQKGDGDLEAQTAAVNSPPAYDDAPQSSTAGVNSPPPAPTAPGPPIPAPESSYAPNSAPSVPQSAYASTSSRYGPQMPTPYGDASTSYAPTTTSYANTTAPVATNDQGVLYSSPNRMEGKPEVLGPLRGVEGQQSSAASLYAERVRIAFMRIFESIWGVIAAAWGVVVAAFGIAVAICQSSPRSNTFPMAFGKLHKSNKDASNFDLEAANSPPAYDGPRSPPRAALQPSASTSAPVAGNHISVIHSSTPIEGTYTIDTSAAPMPFGDFFPSGSASDSSTSPAESANAVFKTESGNIEIDLRVKGGKKAEIQVQTAQGLGHVWVNFPHRSESTPLHLHITGPSDVRVALPASFRGPVSGGSMVTGPIQFSPALRKIGVSTFSVNQQNPLNGKYFIGEWTGFAGAQDAMADRDWQGDRLVVTSERGTVLVQTYEERGAQDRGKALKVGSLGWSWPKKVIRRFWGIFESIWGIFVAVWGVVFAVWEVVAAIFLFLAALVNLG